MVESVGGLDMDNMTNLWGLWIGIAIVLLFLFLSSSSYASTFDATKDLEGKVVVYAGEVESLECPFMGEYDCSTWPREFLKFKYKDVCFSSDIGACESYGCKGFIAIGKDNTPFFFSLEKMGDDIKKFKVKYYKCPDVF